MDANHPALVAARNSWRCVQSKDKEGWLALMADDVRVEDPIGKAPTNPDGLGVRGKQAMAAFWDRNIAPATIVIEPRQSFAAGRESAHHMKLTTTFDNGVRTTVEGIFTYTLDDTDKLSNLRGYWALEDMKVERLDDAT